MTQCSEFRREMSTHGSKGLIYNYYGTPRSPRRDRRDRTNNNRRLKSLKESERVWDLSLPQTKDRRIIYDFILFIKCPTFSLLLLLLLLMLILMRRCRWWYLQFFAYICRIVLGLALTLCWPFAPHSSQTLSISGVMTNAVCNYCIYFVALISQKDSLLFPSHLISQYLYTPCHMPHAPYSNRQKDIRYVAY